MIAESWLSKISTSDTMSQSTPKVNTILRNCKSDAGDGSWLGHNCCLPDEIELMNSTSESGVGGWVLDIVLEAEYAGGASSCAGGKDTTC